MAPVSLKVRGTSESCSSTECTHLLLLEQGVNFTFSLGALVVTSKSFYVGRVKVLILMHPSSSFG